MHFVGRAKFQGLPQEFQLLLEIRILWLATELEACNPADLNRLLKRSIIRKRFSLVGLDSADDVDHALGVFVGAVEVFDLKSGVSHHGEDLDFRCNIVAESELGAKFEHNFGVLVSVTIAGEDAGN